VASGYQRQPRGERKGSAGLPTPSLPKARQSFRALTRRLLGWRSDRGQVVWLSAPTARRDPPTGTLFDAKENGGAGFQCRAMDHRFVALTQAGRPFALLNLLRVAVRES